LCPLRNDAIGGVAPNCDQQLTCHGDDGDAAGALFFNASMPNLASPRLISSVPRLL
jgi:hypothetical protein